MYNNPSVFKVIASASNIVSDEHPQYTNEKFLEMHPKFRNISDVVISAWINIAFSCIQYRRWNDWWEMAIGLFVAHNLTLWVQSEGEDGTNSVEQGLAKGIIGSKSVSDLSISYDFGSIANEFQGWGTYSQTSYGQQLVQLARLIGRGGMTVW